MANFVYIEMNVFTEMHLSGNEAIVYSLVAGFCQNGGRFMRSSEEVAAMLGMTQRGIQKVINRLVKGGYIRRDKKAFVLCDDWKGEQSSSKSEQSSSKSEQSSSKSEQSSFSTLFNNNTINNSYNNSINNSSNNSRAREGFFQEGEKEQSSEKKIEEVYESVEVVEETGDENAKKINNSENCSAESLHPEPEDLYKIVNEAFCRHYKSTHGRDYVPAYRYHTDTIFSLVNYIRHLMASDGYAPTADTVRRYWEAWLQMAYAWCDQWHRDRWTAEYVNNYFSYFTNIIKNHNNGQQTTNRSNQRGGGISEGYLAEALVDATGN